MPPPTSPDLHPPLVQRVVEGLKAPVLVLTGAGPPPSDSPPSASVVLAVSDVVALRDVVAGLPPLGKARMVAVVVADAQQPLALRVEPRWPALQDLDARLEDGAAVTVARFTTRLDVVEVLTGIAYADRPLGHGGLIVATDYSPDDKVPPDIVTTPGTPEESPVLGRAPVVVTDPGPEPLDETLFNPIGFRRDWDRGVIDLDPAWRPTPSLIAGLRDAQAVRISPGADARILAALAMSGVPLVTDEVLDDPAVRERHSVRQRRAALLQHSTVAWRQRLAARTGVRIAEGADLVLVGEGPHGPDVVTDLTLATRYSGADVVEMPARQQEHTECFVDALVGGAMMVERTLLQQLGGPDAVRDAGCSIYRTHVFLEHDESEVL